MTPPLISLPEELYPEDVSNKVVNFLSLQKNKEREKVVKQLTKIYFQIPDPANNPPPKSVA